MRRIDDTQFKKLVDIARKGESCEVIGLLKAVYLDTFAVTNVNGEIKHTRECQVCHETPQEIVVTDCLHHFCKKCLGDWCKAKNVDESECPQCEKVFSAAEHKEHTS
jgi:hypothetical protein